MSEGENRDRDNWAEAAKTFGLALLIFLAIALAVGCIVWLSGVRRELSQIR
jgi:hypothetical protein